MGNEVIAQPVEIKQGQNNELLIHWNDGHKSAYPSYFLRRFCRCALCVDEWSGEKRLDESAIPKDIHPLRIQGVGRYGIKIDWSDGHDTGIYTFKYMRSICPCPDCKHSEVINE